MPFPENGNPAIVRVIPALFFCRLIRITLKIAGIVSNTNRYADTSIFVLLPILKAVKKR
jgi:hypothetical protein